MFKSIHKTLVFFSLIFIVLFGTEECFGKIYVKVDQFSEQKFPIAVTPFKNQSGKKELLPEGYKIEKIIKNDLSFSGLFRFISEKAFLEDPQKSGFTTKSIDFANWAVLDAQALVKGWYELSKKNQLTISVHLFDVLSQKEILSKKFYTHVKSLHETIHKISNEIYRALTGEEGIFDTKIAFVGNRTKNKEIYAMDLDGRNVVQLTSNKSINLSPDWSRDGKKIAFTSFMGGKGSSLYIGDLETKNIKGFDMLRGTVIGPVFNTGGNLIAMTYEERSSKRGYSQKDKVGIFLFDPLTNRLNKLTRGFAINVSPSFSPDGREVVFSSNRSGRVHIYKKQVSAGAKPVRLTFKGIRNVDPAWSPKGDKIAFAGMDTDGHYDIFVMNTDGSSLQRLTYDSKNNEHPSWSPDGQFIIFSSNRSGIFQLYVTKLTAGSEKRQITFSKWNHTMPTWSPRLK